MDRTLRKFWLMLPVAIAAGCTTLFEAEDTVPVGSPLRPAAPSPDGVRFEVYWASLPAELEADQQSDLWRFVQEDRLDGQLRKRLQRNGFRAGIVSGAPPEKLLRLLNPRPELGDHADAAVQGGVLAETGVQKQVITVRPSIPGRINAADPASSATVFFSDGQEVWGEPFHAVQAAYQLAVANRRGGGHVVTLAPELQHGRDEIQYGSDPTSGYLSQQRSRQERQFPELQIAAPMQIGEMLLVTSRAGLSKVSLGGFFHREVGGGAGRRAIVVRMIQAPPPPEFALADAADRPDF